MYLVENEIKDMTENITSASYLYFSIVDRGGGVVVNFTLPFTTNEMISIATLQTFRS